jgi:DNA end-binding protein Ku
MAPRATWKGYLKLSLVSCPVRLHNATTTVNRISFNWLHKDTHNRVQMKPSDPELGQVERSELVKGYEFEKDQYIVVGDEDLEKIQIESTETITIEEFVDADDVDPIFLDSPYFLAPDGPVADETFRVIHKAMGGKNKAALGRVVLSGRERRVIITLRGNGLMLTTLRVAAEVRRHEEYFSDITDGDLDDEALKLAELIISQNEGAWDSSEFEDQYQKELLEIVMAKIKGTKPVITKAPERGKVINLMDALKQSIDDGGLKKPPAKSKRRKAAPAKKSAAAKTSTKASEKKAATKAA